MRRQSQVVCVQAMIDAVLGFVRDNRDWAFWIALVFAFGAGAEARGLLGDDGGREGGREERGG